MFKVFAFLLACVVCVGCFWGGSMAQDHAQLNSEHAHAREALAMVGIYACGQSVGAVTVQRNGVLMYDDKMPMEKQQQLAKSLPDDNAQVVVINCVTKHQGEQSI